MTHSVQTPQRPGVDVEIVNFGATTTPLLKHLVERLGYRTCLRDRRDWLHDKAGTERCVVLHFGPPLEHHADASRHLETLAAPAVLSVFEESPQNPDDRLLNASRDFLFWPCSSSELHARLARLNSSRAPSALPQSDDVTQLAELGLVGSSPALVQVLRMLKRIAPTAAPVLLCGESGTGKEVVARAIHYLSDRRDYPFIPVNCGALPDHLLENELFGHERGAYTDAKVEQPGVVEQAAGGTLFLDEIGTLSTKGQCTLLRFLQNQEFRRLGGREVRHGNVRIVAATNAKLKDMVARGSFRDDLYYRLDILAVTLPPLRERAGDALALAYHFLECFRRQYGAGPTRISRHSCDWMARYDWPGNVRELESLIHRQFLLAEDGCLNLDGPMRSEDQELDAAGATRVASRFKVAKAKLIREFEREYLVDVMRQAGGNVSHAARLAGQERRAFGRLLKKHGVAR